MKWRGLWGWAGPSLPHSWTSTDFLIPVWLCSPPLGPLEACVEIWMLSEISDVESETNFVSIYFVVMIFQLYEQRKRTEEAAEGKSLKQFTSMWDFPLQSFEWCLYVWARHIPKKSAFKKIGPSSIQHAEAEANSRAHCIIF